MRKTLLTAAAVIAIAVASTTWAGYNEDLRQNKSFYDQARVIHVQPIIRTIQVAVPERECWQEEVRHPGRRHHRHTTGKTIVGGVIGGVIGNQFGSGRGKTAATIAGTLIGVSVARDIAKKSVHHERTSYEQHCRTIDRYHNEERTVGYWVTYRYRGETFRTRLAYDPGERLAVQVRVTPVRR